MRWMETYARIWGTLMNSDSAGMVWEPVSKLCGVREMERRCWRTGGTIRVEDSRAVWGIEDCMFCGFMPVLL